MIRWFIDWLVDYLIGWLAQDFNGSLVYYTIDDTIAGLI